MTASESLASQAELVEVLPPTFWERGEERLARWSERLNPILVKEARQALRSRQFSLTFFLMLAAGWAWSMLGLALLGPAAYYSADGASMFYVFYFILAAPLLIVIPYGAYQSLSAERQDRTFELLSITTLGAGQILAGKLAACGLQMMVYLSALFPCLAFTYLLRGLDIVSVLMIVAYTCLMSLGLSMIGLLLGALAPSRQRQIVQGVLFAVGLVWIFLLDVAAIFDVVGLDGAAIREADFWGMNLFLATLYANAFALVFLSARSLLTPVSQNRSTALRVALVVAQLTFVAWAAWAVLAIDADVVYGLIASSTILWAASGILMVGEPSVLSPRVKRSLPQSVLGRMFFTWFMPGPGTGYLFVVSNMIGVWMICVLMATPELVEMAGAAWNSYNRIHTGHTWTVFETCLLATGYVMIYLGLCRLIHAFLRRFGEVGLAMRVLVPVILLIVGGAVPWVIQLANPGLRGRDYTLLQVMNPVWTLWEFMDRGGVPVQAEAVLLWLVPLAALVVWGLNLPSAAREVAQVRTVKPPRVVDDDAQQATVATPEPVRSSPWDDEQPAGV